MNHVVSDWTRAADQNLGTYRRFMRMTMVSSAFLIILLILMALFLL